MPADAGVLMDRIPERFVDKAGMADTSVRTFDNRKERTEDLYE